jgi:protein SCO1/2
MIVLAALLALVVTGAQAQAPPVDRVAFAPRTGALMPRDARFVDEHGSAVTLADYVDSRAAIPGPGYFACSNLCSLVARGVAAALAASGLQAGRDVDVVVVSIDPSETPADALARKRDLVGAEAAGWHFLVGSDAAIARFTDALGYRYAYDEHERQFAHAAGIVVTAPGGRVQDVLYGVAYRPEALRASVQGTASPVAADATEWLLCFHYDPASGRYTFAAMNAVRLAALAALIALAALVLRGRRRR